MTFHFTLDKKNKVDIDDLCQRYLTILYQGVQRKSISPKNNVAEFYGEVLYPSVDKLLAEIQPSYTDVFVDYGSGLGQMVIQVFLKSQVKEAYGIELLPDLHQHAFKAAIQLQQEIPEFYHEERKLKFLLGDFLEIKIPATIAMVSSTCFNQSLLWDLGKIIENTPSIHTVLSLRPIKTLKRLSFKKTIRLECSWDTTLCYVYK